METTTQTHATSVKRYIPLGSTSNTTLSEFRAQPDALFGAHDVAAVGIIGSRASLSRAVRAGKLPKPIRLPSGRLAWRGRVITDWLDNLERRCAV